MRLRGLLIATVLLAAMAGGVYWSNRYEKAKEGKPSPDASPQIVSIPQDQVRKIEIRRKAGEMTIVERDQAGTWRIAAPQSLPADNDAITSLVSAASSLSSDRLVEEKDANLAEFGLQSPAVELAIIDKDGKAKKVLIGDETPTGSGYFVKTEGDPRVFTIAGFSKSGLDKTAKDLRDKRLLTFDADKLSRLELRAKNQTVEFGKNNQNEWQIVQPRPMRADNWAVEELVRRLRDAKMDTTISDEDAKKAVSAFASATPVAVAKVTDASASQQIELRRDKDKNYWARSSVVEGIHKVAADVGDGLDKGIDDFRNKKLFDFAFSDPTRIEFRDGDKTRVFQKADAKWTSDGKEMDSTSVQALVDRLRDLSAAKFVERPLAAQQIEIAVTSNEGKRVERVQIAKSGDAWTAKRENDPVLYELESSVAPELQKLAAEVKPAATPAKK